MKRSFLLALFCLLLSSSFFTSSYAQQGMKPLRNLGIGIEVGTTGIGFDLAVPVNNFMVVRGGYSFFPYSYSDSYNVNFNDNDRQSIQNVINNYPEILQELENQKLPTDVNTLNDEVNLDAKLGLSNGKIVVDFYPFQKSSFHVVAGLYMGKSRLIKLNGNIDADAAKLLQIINERYPGEDFHSSISFEEYTIQADQNGRIEAALKINSVKPYIGLGIGNSIPKKRVGFHFEIGAMYQGKPEIISDNGTVTKTPGEDGSSGVTKVLEKISVYPMVSFKLTGRIL